MHSGTAVGNFLGTTSIQRTFSHSVKKHESQGDEEKRHKKQWEELEGCPVVQRRLRREGL